MNLKFVEKQFLQIASESTCQKRVTVCELYAVIPEYANSPGYGKPKILVASESNRCSPPNGKCVRLEIKSTQAGYPEHSECNWEHAEMRALRANTSGLRPVEAVIYGHTFPCKPCEDALHAAGVKWIICKDRPENFRGEIGLRKQSS